MGITVQSWTEEGVMVRTLALRDTEARHDSPSVKDLVLGVLGDFEIGLHQVLVAVVDNAANMTRAVALLNEEAERERNDREEEGDDDDDLGDLADVDDEEEGNPLPSVVSHMRCAEHTAAGCAGRPEEAAGGSFRGEGEGRRHIPPLSPQ